MKKKKLIVGITMVPIVSFASFVSYINPELTGYAILGDELLKNPTPWVNKGTQYDCSEWTPDPSTINYGLDFKQNQDCSQDQERQIEVYQTYVNKPEKYLRTETQNQTVTETNEQDEIGTKDFITTVTYGEWSVWTDVDFHYDCLTWNPDPSTIDYGQAFTQNRDCSQDQERERNVFDNWAAGSQTLNSVEFEDKTITETESQQSVGTRNYVAGTSYGDWSAWVDKGSHYDCLLWTPDPSTIDYGQSFTQNRDCSQDQERERDVFNDYADGTQTLVSVEIGEQTLTEVESQGATGTRNYVAGTSYGNWSAWVDKGSHYDCEIWSPATSTVDYGQSFTQNRDCSQDQERERDVFDDYADGSKVLVSVEVGTQTLTERESQAATGTRNYVAGTSYGSWSAWSDSGNHYDCDTWSPSVTTINHGTAFTQNRDCKQNQTRTRTIYDDYADGSKVAVGVDTGTQTLTERESQGAIGSKDYIIGTVVGSWGAWVDSGSHYDCGSYSPATTTVNHGTVFTQTRSCKQNQTRTRTIYNDWKVGANTYKSTETGSQTINENETRSATGTKDYIVGTITGSWGSWYDVGGHYSCGSYSPATTTVNHGTVFTQTRSCKQNQNRTRTIYNDWKVGANTVKTTETGSQTINENETRSATGTKDYVIGTVYGSWSSWSNDGSVHSCGSYSPSTSTVNHGTSFTQTRTCKQPQKQTRSVYDDWKVGANTYKSTETNTRTIDSNQTRTVTGTKDYIIGTVYGSWSSWADSGGHYSCGSWSPDPSTVNSGTSFTQTRSCKQNQTQSRTVYNDWKVGANTYKSTESNSRTINENETRSATGTKPVTECKYGYSSSPSYAIFHQNGLNRIYWAGSLISEYYGPPNKAVGSWYYYNGAIKNQAGTVYWYEVCRRPN